jgi:hypothetical protein
MSKPQIVKYKKAIPAHGEGPAWEVRVDDSPTMAGTVEKINGYWCGFYNDGGQAYGNFRRIDAAWALINS